MFLVRQVKPLTYLGVKSPKKFSWIVRSGIHATWLLRVLISLSPPQGNMAELTEMTGWEGQKVLYFGDHPYADLADLSLNYGWRTGALIQERV